MTKLRILIDEKPQSCYDVPLSATSEKLHEAMYFYAKMLETYHEPEVFRFNLNAFIQSQRSIEDVLRNELKSIMPEWKRWYSKAKDRLYATPLLNKFRGLRNFVVHQGMLEATSHAFVGAMRYRKPKLGFEREVDPFIDSRDLLEQTVRIVNDGGHGFIPESHPFIGEEYGVERTWAVSELGPHDVTVYCRDSFAATQCIVAQAVALAGGWLSLHRLPNAGPVRILTESDADPTLPEKWGWGTEPKPVI